MFLRPDWRDSAQYKTLHDRRDDPGRSTKLAWEFIRRSPEYQSDIAQYVAEADPARRKSFWPAHFRTRWGLRMVKPPSEDVDYPIFGPWDLRTFIPFQKWQPSSGPRVMIPVDLSRPLESIEETVLGVVRALREAGIENGSIQPVTGRVLSPTRYVEQLRILDASDAHATFAEIGEGLYPGATNDPESKQRDKRIRAAHKAALKMQGGGWRILIA